MADSPQRDTSGPAVTPSNGEGTPQGCRPVRRAGRLPARRGWLMRGAVLAFDALVLVAVLGALGLFLLADRDIALPAALTERVAARLDADLPGARLEIARMSLRITPSAAPVLGLQDLRLTAPGPTPDARARQLLRIPHADIGLQRRALLAGRLSPDALRVDGARLLVARDADGRFDLGLAGVDQPATPASLPDVLRALDTAFAQPALAPVREISATGLTLELRDARAGRAWVVENGRITLSQGPEEIRIAAALTLPGDARQGPGGDMLLPEAEVILTGRRDGSGATVAARLQAIPAADIAAQSRGLAWLGPLEAPVSGALRAELGADGRIGAVSAKLEIASGALQPAAALQPVPFDMARAYFTYLPDEGRLTFEDLRLRGPVLSLEGTAQAYLQMDPDRPGEVARIVTQLQARDVTVTPPGLLARPAVFDSANADLRITLEPFGVELGQMSLRRAAPAGAVGQGAPETPAAGDAASPESLWTGTPDGPLRILASGRAEAREDGWHGALDATVAQAGLADVAAFWPEPLAPRTRAWVGEHVRSARIGELRAALRFRPGEPVRRQINWRFTDARIAPLDGFPALRGAAGFAALTGAEFSLTLERGAAAAPGHAPIDLSGTSFRIPDARDEPPRAELGLEASGDLPGLLALLDAPPLSLLKDLPPDLVLADAGQAALSGQVGWHLRSDPKLADMDLSVSAELRDLSASDLIPGHVLTAQALTLRADPELLTVSGAARVSGVPVRAVFARGLGPGASGARVEGTMEVSPDSLEALGIALPPGTLEGAGIADFALDLGGQDAPARLRVSSDLNRVRLSVPALGWSKPATTTGALRVEAILGTDPSVPVLSLEAPGLTAQGAVRLDPEGAFAGLDLSRLQAGGWLDTGVRLRPRGPGAPPAVTLTGGRLRLAGLPQARGTGGGGGGRASPVRLENMRLDLSERIALTALSGNVRAERGGMSGSLSARVNGAAPIRGQLVPDTGGRGTAIRVTGADAGAILRAAGLFDRANDGELSLVLRPLGGGAYDGQLNVTDTRVTSAPGLATLLNAISIVGLLDQLSGPGILFTSIDAAFRLTPDALEVRQGSGVGPSMGISMAGVYDMRSDRLDMQGTLSPIYVLNSIGQIFTRRGEGLFGFNYRMTGPARAPQVSVNPLSVLTPGMFRDLFRAPPPRLTD